LPSESSAPLEETSPYFSIGYDFDQSRTRCDHLRLECHDVTVSAEHERTTRSGLRIAIVVVAIGMLLITVPSMSAAFNGATHIQLLGDDGQGEVLISSCNRGALVEDWTCRGIWQSNDPMAYPATSHIVTVANNARELNRGTDLGYVYSRPSSKIGYMTGTTQQLETIGFWIGVLTMLAAIGLTFLRRFRRNTEFAVLAFGIGVLCLVASWPLLSI
jgi:hypothetical protein